MPHELFSPHIIIISNKLITLIDLTLYADKAWSVTMIKKHGLYVCMRSKCWEDIVA